MTGKDEVEDDAKDEAVQDEVQLAVMVEDDEDDLQADGPGEVTPGGMGDVLVGLIHCDGPAFCREQRACVRTIYSTVVRTCVLHIWGILLVCGIPQWVNPRVVEVVVYNLLDLLLGFRGEFVPVAVDEVEEGVGFGFGHQAQFYIDFVS